MKVVLLGYMASGKSTVGKYLAAKLVVPFIDLDNYIESKEEKSISEIFKDKGEIYFRTIEHQYLKKIINSNKDFVLSLGGGTPSYAGNMDVILQSEAKSVYLNTSLGVLIERLKKHKDKRPLVASLDNDKIAEFVAKHLFERRFFYEKAQYKVLTDHKKLSEIVAEIGILLY